MLHIIEINQFEKTRKLLQKYSWTERIRRFREIDREHPPQPKSMLMSMSTQHPRYRYYSSAKPLYELCNTRERRKALKSRQQKN